MLSLKDKGRYQHCRLVKIVIIIGKTALFKPYPSLENSARLHPDFISLDPQQYFFTQQSRQPCVQPPT
jgi:hypothetical protein